MAGALIRLSAMAGAVAPAQALAHSLGCTTGWTKAGGITYFAVTGASLLVMVAAPVLAGWWSPGSAGRRVAVAVLLALVAGGMAVALGVGNFALGNGCASPWGLMALNALPACILGAVALWLRQRHARRLAREPRALRPAGGWALLLALQGLAIAIAVAALILADMLSRAARKGEDVPWLLVLRLGLEPLLMALLVWWLYRRRRKAQAACGAAPTSS